MGQVVIKNTAKVAMKVSAALQCPCAENGRKLSQFFPSRILNPLEVAVGTNLCFLYLENTYFLFSFLQAMFGDSKTG